MQFRGQGPSTVGIVFDSDMNPIDRVLALALLYGVQGKGDARVISVSVNRASLSAAAFCDALSQFYLGPPGSFFGNMPIGLATDGKPGSDIAVSLDHYPHSIER